MRIIETKVYTADQIRTIFEKMPKDLKIKVLYEAIDIMQQYNGRSRFLCIAMAMGYENFEGESDTYELVQ
jgi:DNA helicase TIP49 (TBP-interacting protein)